MGTVAFSLNPFTEFTEFNNFDKIERYDSYQDTPCLTIDIFPDAAKYFFTTVSG